jgi:anti-anti-sigma factor
MGLADLQTTVRDGVLVAEVTGEIDLSNAEELGEQILAELPGDARAVVIDLSQVGFLDSVGIFVIYGMRENLRERDKKLGLVVPPSSPIASTLALVGMTERVRSGDTLADVMVLLR